MKKSILFFGLVAGTLGFMKAQNVNIPDANFKAYLVGNSSINTNGDSEIQVSEAEAFTGRINIQSKNITDLTGIEAFLNIEELQCNHNKLTTLDVSKNTALKKLSCYTNQLTNLDVSKNTALTDLQCNQNQLTALDVSKNTALKYLLCYQNQLTTLDVTQNTALTNLECQQNQLTSLDVTQNTALKVLNCNENQLTSLDVTQNTALTSLYCSYNELSNLDISKNTALIYLYCAVNQLTSLNLKNGNNSNLFFMTASWNPNLTCIQVDNVANANSYSGWQKDATASYSEDCLLSVADITKKEIAIYPNPVKEILNFSEEVSNVRITDLSGRTVKQISASAKSVNVANLAKGVYIITATAKTGETITKKIIKE